MLSRAINIQSKFPSDGGIYLGAVDMDVYGAFQLCSIGILAAPVTVKLSRTYFYDPGRNTIFAWTALILAGELLAVSHQEALLIRIHTFRSPQLNSRVLPNQYIALSLR